MFEPVEDSELRAGRVKGPAAPTGEGSALGSTEAGAAASPEQITFEQGYEELKAIVARLDEPELPVHEMFEAFRRGKGLEKTLRAYLQEREGELAELEEGNNLAEFEIVAPSNG
jgi:exodeoxyribonuclease VII small subunit